MKDKYLGLWFRKHVYSFRRRASPLVSVSKTGCGCAWISIGPIGFHVYGDRCDAG